MSLLLDKQQRFAYMTSQLIVWAWANGYRLTYGEAWRTPEQAVWNEQHGLGISASLHRLKLAVDFNLFKNGVILETRDDYLPLGIYWESLGGSWGGRFAKPDSDHFSLEHEGIR